MKILFILIIICVVIFFKYNKDTLDYPPIPNINIENYDELFPHDGIDGNWEYLNEHKKLHTKEDVYCLQQNIFFEAAIEDSIGKIAVGITTLNRVKSNKFPNTICEVVKESYTDYKNNPIINKCQFSWYCNGISDIPDLSNDYIKRVWDEIGILSKHLIENNNNYTHMKNVTHYHNVNVTPNWSKTYKKHSKIGDHIFYESSF
jgi:spore germination cell wall hydrolase CwlJ-like protein